MLHELSTLSFIHPTVAAPTSICVTCVCLRTNQRLLSTLSAH